MATGQLMNLNESETDEAACCVEGHLSADSQRTLVAVSTSRASSAHQLIGGGLECVRVGNLRR